MTRDDIIRLAQQTGYTEAWITNTPNWLFIVKFAALVAAAERERLAMVFDKEEDRPYYGRHVAQKLRKLGAK
jgi:hypothetical protein